MESWGRIKSEWRISRISARLSTIGRKMPAPLRFHAHVFAASAHGLQAQLGD
jgi:hypothetical protein